MYMEAAGKIELFYVYAHKDKRIRARLDIHLAPLKREGRITTWHDQEILAGTVWETVLAQHLESADIILLLISPDFIASDYCYSVAMRRALERMAAGQAHVIPVILNSVDW